MATIKVRPAEGARVVQPGPGGMPIPAEGAEVPDIAYYRRLILTGDLIDLDAREAAASIDGPGIAAEPAIEEPSTDAAQAGQEAPKPDAGRRRAREQE